MQPTYTIAGADGQTYGPASLSEMKDWIREGRVSPDTNVSRNDTNAWHPASHYAELEMSSTPALAPISGSTRAEAPPISAAMLESEKKSRSGASWLYWIAGLSAVNAIAFFSGGDWSFFFGLGSLQIISALGSAMEDSIGTTVAIGLNVIGVALFILLGFFAYKKHSWAFIVGMVLYALDSVCFLLASDYLGLILHALALWWIFSGFRANQEWKEMQSE